MTDLQEKLIKSKYNQDDGKTQTKSYIRKALKGYMEIKAEDLEKNVFIRYIAIKNGQLRLFKGGYLVYNKQDTVRLRGGKYQWIVHKQYFNTDGDVVFTTRFFRKPIKRDYLEKRIEKIEKVNLALIKTVKKLENRLKSLSIR